MMVNTAYENQLKGLLTAEPFLAENSILIIDDTNNINGRRGTEDFMRVSKNQWHIILDQSTYCNMHPTFWNGIMIIRKGEKK